MGNVTSAVPYAFNRLIRNIRVFFMLSGRIRAEPGLPVDNPTRSFWMYPPSPIARYSSDLPQYADIVVIGSGITGTSVARHLLDQVQAEENQLPVLLMLEARDACSGATGRNGGHITPCPYEDFTGMQEYYDDDVADKYTKFRHSHIEELRRTAEEEGLLEHSQWRQVETIEVYFNQDLFEEAKEAVRAYGRAVPSEASYHRVYESSEAIQKYCLAQDVIGCITSDAGAINPYRFVTGILSNLLRRYPDNFLLCTNTPCTSIMGPSKLDSLYTLVTPKGIVRTPHVIHATNAWSSQLLKPMRGRIIPYRGYMTAQRPGQSLPTETRQRSFSFHEADSSFYDYLTQLPNGEYEFMFGGGSMQDGGDGNEDIGNTDDSTYNKSISAYLGGVLPRYFGEHNWGREGQPPEGDTADKDVEWPEGRVKAAWTGIVGQSADQFPWVGRLPCSISGRGAPSTSQGIIPMPPGEWIAAGYSGEGMVQAWLCGKALAEMILGREDEADLMEWFPDIFRVSMQRWREADWVTMLSGQLSDA